LGKRRQAEIIRDRSGGVGEQGRKRRCGVSGGGDMETRHGLHKIVNEQILAICLRGKQIYMAMNMCTIKTYHYSEVVWRVMVILFYRHPAWPQ
jgi:hypothetical protein